MLPQWQTGVIKKIEQATPNTRRYWVELPDTEVFNFLPGQFVTVDLPISQQRNKRWRSYSIASMPNGGNVIELVIVHITEGLATTYLFNTLNIGDTITLRGPFGMFLLPKTLEKELFLICTGTGIAPYRSMLLQIEAQKIAFNKIYLIFGTRTQADLLYEQEMRNMELSIPGFYYLPTLSRQQWDGATGYVHQVYETLCKQHQPATFMLCGWKPMVDEATDRILKLGYDKKDILHEVYG